MNIYIHDTITCIYVSRIFLLKVSALKSRDTRLSNLIRLKCVQEFSIFHRSLKIDDFAQNNLIWFLNMFLTFIIHLYVDGEEPICRQEDPRPWW